MKAGQGKKRIIVDYKKISPEVNQALEETFPHGYEDSDIVKFVNLKGETVSALSVETDDAIYLVKMHVEMPKKGKVVKVVVADDEDDDTDETIDETPDIDEKDEDASDDDDDDNYDD
jgi:hypothetical protein